VVTAGSTALSVTQRVFAKPAPVVVVSSAPVVLKTMSVAGISPQP
jgi:hypothetical protein